MPLKFHFHRLQPPGATCSGLVASARVSDRTVRANHRAVRRAYVHTYLPTSPPLFLLLTHALSPSFLSAPPLPPSPSLASPRFLVHTHARVRQQEAMTALVTAT